jgi:hypothetical protein
MNRVMVSSIAQSQASETATTSRSLDEQTFVRGLVERGEAAHPGKDGKLPPGATHEIVGQGPDGLPIVRRRRIAIR